MALQRCREAEHCLTRIENRKTKRGTKRDIAERSAPGHTCRQRAARTCDQGVLSNCRVAGGAADAGSRARPGHQLQQGGKQSCSSTHHGPASCSQPAQTALQLRLSVYFRLPGPLASSSRRPRISFRTAIRSPTEAAAQAPLLAASRSMATSKPAVTGPAGAAVLTALCRGELTRHGQHEGVAGVARALGAPGRRPQGGSGGSGGGSGPGPAARLGGAQIACKATFHCIQAAGGHLPCALGALWRRPPRLESGASRSAAPLLRRTGRSGRRPCWRRALLWGPSDGRPRQLRLALGSRARVAGLQRRR